MSQTNPFRQHWQLGTAIDQLNHGSFGATPTAVLRAQREFQDALEREPLRFLALERELEPKLDLVRERVASLVQAAATDIVFVRSATDGVNAVLRSLPLDPGDEIVVTDHGYNACNNAARFVCQPSGANLRVAKIPFPLSSDQEAIAAIDAELSPRTKVLLVDHVTSPSALVLPIGDIIRMAHDRGARVLVDGAHAPGMLPVNLRELNADYYTGNHHKWLCAPKTSGFLYVRSDLQSEVRPTVISHGANTTRAGRSRFWTEFDWVGTYDPCPLLAVPNAIDFVSHLMPGGLEEHMRQLKEKTLQARRLVLDALRFDSPAPESMVGSMAAVPLPGGHDVPLGEVDPLQRVLYDKYQIEIPVFRISPGGQRVIRFSVQAYNNLSQYEKLAAAIRDELTRH